MTAEPLSREVSHSRAHAEGWDGWDYMEHPESRGWQHVASWGADGWDLGSWPLVILSVRAKDGTRWGLRIYTEGDLDTRWYASRAALVESIDEWAAWWWRCGQADRPEGLPAKGSVPERFRGPYGSRRAPAAGSA